MFAVALNYFITARKRSLREGNVFTLVILFTGGGGVHPPGHKSHLPPTVNKGAVPILLECFLVFTARNSSCGKVMFSQVSVCPQGAGVHHAQAHTPPWTDTPLPRLLLQGTVRILLECILVFFLMFGGHQSFLLCGMILNDTMFKRHAKVWLSKCDVKDYCNTK